MIPGKITANDTVLAPGAPALFQIERRVDCVLQARVRKMEKQIKTGADGDCIDKQAEKFRKTLSEAARQASQVGTELNVLDLWGPTRSKLVSLVKLAAENPRPRVAEILCDALESLERDIAALTDSNVEDLDPAVGRKCTAPRPLTVKMGLNKHRSQLLQDARESELLQAEKAFSKGDKAQGNACIANAAKIRDFILERSGNDCEQLMCFEHAVV